jgi:TatD DNase family protein
MLIDTHCHLTFPELAGQVEAVLARAEAAGVSQLLTVATTAADAQGALEILKFSSCVFLVAGIHPHEAARAGPEELAALARLHRPGGMPPVLEGRLVAVGEAGLDFHYDFAPPEVQERVFRAQIELALAVGRPLVIHARSAEPRVCEILAEYPDLAGRFVFHCFSGGPELAERIVSLGGWVSFTGVVTFRTAGAVQAAAQIVPFDRMMIETDAPYLAPEPMRKVRPNEPALVVHTARRLAELRGVSYDELAARTTENARRFFGIEPPGSASAATPALDEEHA